MQQNTDPAVPGISFQSNFDYYGLFQSIALEFGRTLNNVEEVYDLKKRYLKHGSSWFMLNAAKEYVDAGRSKTFGELMTCMGTMYVSKMQSIDPNSYPNTPHMNQYASSAMQLGMKKLKISEVETLERGQ